jgi:hypothetical protein
MQARSTLHRLLQRDALLAATAGLAIVNGLPVTPRFDSISHVLYLFTRGSSVIGGDVLFYATSGVMALMTLLIGGIPAAIYERIRGQQESTPVSLGIWLVATALLALPALRAATGLW